MKLSRQLPWRNWKRGVRAAAFCLPAVFGAGLSAIAQEHGAAPAAEAGGHAAPPGPLDIIVSQTAWAIASFALVLFVLLTKLFPRIVGAMDKRDAEIRSGLEAAEKARAEAREMMARHQSDLDKARKEAAAIIEEGKADALRLKDSIVASAKKETEEITSRSRREIELAKQTALDVLHQRSVELSLDLTRRLIQKSLNPADHHTLIDERIRGLPAA